ncbi:MAG: hypothetical protein JRF40_04555 [Deltaproteobacteria bacterium]|nr:hypothetical protein [Deltaproteobacteria bacterium]MBW2218753.1 hypothetical protein [Deltaproteobacteria bacterium]
MSFTIRQICLVADKLQPIIEDFSQVLKIENCYSDPQVDFFGLENVLLPIGTDFIEIVAPIRDNTPAGRYLERRSGNGGYMVLLQADSEETQASSLTRAKEMGIRVAFEGTLETYHFLQLHPADTGGSFLQIDWDSQNQHNGYWYNAGGNGWKEYVNRDTVSAIVAVELQAEEPAFLAQRWGEILDIPVTNNKHGNPELVLNNGVIRVVTPEDGRGEGLGAVDLKVVNRKKLLASAQTRGLKVSDSQVIICGVRFNLVQKKLQNAIQFDLK